jgi:hypothetical protein
MPNTHLHRTALTSGVAALIAVCTACAGDPPDTAKPVTPAASGCVATGDGSLQAQLRGAVTADIHWSNHQMECAGGARPDGKGLRITLAGPLPADAAHAARRLRFIFGVSLVDAAPGAAQVLPTNLTVIVEGEQQLYATRGDDKCAVETLDRTPLLSSAGTQQRVHARGYCTAPASDLSGSAHVLVPTFEFTGLINSGNER